jgi:hypothetical protein
MKLLYSLRKTEMVKNDKLFDRYYYLSTEKTDSNDKKSLFEEIIDKRREKNELK